MNYIDDINFNAAGLVAVICQDFKTDKVLMMAWMNKQALDLSIQKNKAVFYSRSRQKLWHKGEESGFFLNIKDIRLDCDGDVILLKVEQIGGISCHTGRLSCFYRRLKNNNQWESFLNVLKDPAIIYKKNKNAK
ncbi:MAG: phosphoribosyl-AMP cyclohydrolase [Gammaproteobacteria bacterium]|nr:MAG: phosphoribosyl-AMP cyclohydrolase [Gammaproteobacteria bacterium]